MSNPLNFPIYEQCICHLLSYSLIILNNLSFELGFVYRDDTYFV